MKKVLVLLLICLLFGLLGYTQTIPPEKVPATVKEAFVKKFPAATNVEYKMDMKDYKVTFKDKEVGKYANFNSRGEWLQTKTIMIQSDLPKEVLTSVATNCVGFLITEVTKTEGPGNVTNYEVKLKKDKEVYEVKFTPKGEILKKTPLKK